MDTSDEKMRSTANPDFPSEKTHDIEASRSDSNFDEGEGSFDEIHRTRHLQNNIAIFRKLRRAEEWMDSKVGVELQGVDRIPEEAKEPPSTWNIFLLWWSLNVHVGVIPLGVIGPQFGLSLQQSIAALVVGTILGALCTAFTGTLGPRVSHWSRVHVNAANIISSVFARSHALVTRSASGAQSSVRFSMSLAVAGSTGVIWLLSVKSSVPSLITP